MPTILTTLLLIALLALEWWRGWRTVRIIAVVFTLSVLLFAQPAPYRALRRAITLPPAERDTTFGPGGRRLSEYESGAMTMYRLGQADARMGADARGVALGALVWLAMSPMLREAWSRRLRGRAGVASSRAAHIDQAPPAA